MRCRRPRPPCERGWRAENYVRNLTGATAPNRPDSGAPAGRLEHSPVRSRNVGHTMDASGRPPRETRCGGSCLVGLYNTARPHSSRVYRPSAPETIQPLHFVPATPPRSEVAGLAERQTLTCLMVAYVGAGREGEANRAPSMPIALFVIAVIVAFFHSSVLQLFNLGERRSRISYRPLGATTAAQIDWLAINL
ncbi:hypothetical protein K2D_19920 [Planctomycetes bacterium K2D]|nr:hypothetical protein K2D_19920 [Planctomycetes bacterium K2D]